MMKVLHFSIENDMKYDECGIMKSEERWRHLPRRFRMWVLGICTSGTMHMNIEGTEYRIIPGDYFLFPVTRLHYGTRLSDGPISYYWIHFIAPDIGKANRIAHLDAVDDPSHPRMPEDRFDQTACCRWRDHIVAHTLDLHFRTRKACVIAPDLQRNRQAKSLLSYKTDQI